MITMVSPKASRPRIADCAKTFERLVGERKFCAVLANTSKIARNASEAPWRSSFNCQRFERRGTDTLARERSVDIVGFLLMMCAGRKRQ